MAERIRRGWTRRPGTALMLTLLAVASLGTGCAAGPAAGPPTGQGTRLVPSNSAHRPGIPEGVLDLALLQPGGLGSGWRQSTHPPEPPPWPWLQADCPAYRDEEYPAQRHRTDAVQRRYWHEQSELVASQVVEVYEPGWAVRALDDVRRVLGACPTYDAYGATVSFTLLDTDLPPGDGLAVQGRIESPGVPARSTLLVTVRHGERLSTLNLPGPVDRSTAYSAAKQLGDLLE